jgi:hypothetical protein
MINKINKEMRCSMNVIPNDQARRTSGKEFWRSPNKIEQAARQSTDRIITQMI